MSDPIIIRPQPKQEEFLSCAADIVIFGGAAGGGKTRGLIMDAARFTDNPQFGAVIFRRTSPEITNQGGMWDEAAMIYPGMGAFGTRHNLTYRFPKGARIRFSHLENEDDKLSWSGSQIAYIGFDEITMFSTGQFWYMTSRNRTVAPGIKPRIRGTCNPDPDSFVAKLIEWYIDEQTGYPIPERAGKIRWFVRSNDELHWGDYRKELVAQFGPDTTPISFCFIPSNVFDNPILLKANPAYLATLKALPRVERERLLGGNWKIRASAGTVFRREWFEVVDAAPASTLKIRYWDLAASEVSSSNPDPDWTVGLLLSKSAQGIYFVEDVVRFRGTPAKVEQVVINTASRDGRGVTIGFEQDPGQAGKAETSYYSRLLAGYVFKEFIATKDKVTRAGPVSSQAEAGNVKVVRGAFLEALMQELENFPDGRHDDQIDGLSGAFNSMIETRNIFLG